MVLDVPTRWNSTYEMLKRAYALRVTIEVYVPTDEKLVLCQISSSEWDNVRDLVSMLKPLKDATVYLSGSAYITISSTLPTYIAIIHVILFR